MTHSLEEVRQLLCALGDHVLDTVISSRGVEMAAVEGRTQADTIYAIDRIADEALMQWFEQYWPDVELVTESLDQSVVIGEKAMWTVIVDPIDGTRGLMYDKRSAWCLAAAATRGGSLRDIVVASMTELPTSKQMVIDQLSGARGGGLVAERVDLRAQSRRPLRLRPSSATDLEHGFGGLAKFFPPGKPALASLEAELFVRLDAKEVFDDQYLSSGGQLYELIAGHDRFVADLRALVAGSGLMCHPYDVCTSMLLEEAGGVVGDPRGVPLDAPLDTTSPVAWVGYANPALAGRIGPILKELLGAR